MTREEFLKPLPVWPCEPCETPDRGKQYVRLLSLEELDRLDKFNRKDEGQFAILLFCLSLSDEHGQRILLDADMPWVRAGGVPPRTIKKVIEQSADFNDLPRVTENEQADQAAAERKLEEVEKNSPSSPTNSSATP